MQILSIAALALMATTYVFAQEDIDRNEIPAECRSVCSNLVAVSDECDRLFNDDSDELDCVCQAENAQTVIPLCAACVTSTRNGTREDDDNDDNDDANDHDVNDLRSSCSFSTTTYISTSSYAQVSLVAATSGASSRTGSTTRSTSGSTSGGAFSTTSLPATGTNPAATLSSGVSGLVASVTDNAGAMVTPAPKIEGVGALAGAAFLAVAALA